MLKSLFIALAMYSKIPVPILNWNEKDMQYALGFFPLVGVIIGVFYVAVFKAFDFWHIGILKATLLTALPIAITGGIHADGFIDTMDAVSSYQSRERKLEILKDPHVGAFGIIWTIIFFILYLGFISEVSDEKQVIIIACGFVLSRFFSGLSVMTMKNAKGEGMLFSFSKDASKAIVITMLSVFAVLSFSLSIYTFWQIACLVLASSIVWVIIFRRFAVKTFGGITGDLAGFFLQVCELIILMAVVVGGRIWS